MTSYRWSEDNERECIANTTLVTLFAKKSFPPGHWSFLGPGSENKVVLHSTYNERPQGEWDKVAELMMIKFGGSGHPVFRATSPLSRGTFKSKGGGKWSVHFCADGDTIETDFRTIISVNQLSIYGAVSDVCDEYSACHVRTERPVLAGQSDPLFEPVRLLITTPTPSTEVLAQEILFQKVRKNEWKGPHNKIEWTKDLYWCRILENSWSRTVLHDKRHWRVVTNYRTSDMSWVHFATRRNNQLTRHVFIRVNTKIGPVFEDTTSYLQGKYGVEIRIESVKQR